MSWKNKELFNRHLLLSRSNTQLTRGTEQGPSPPGNTVFLENTNTTYPQQNSNMKELTEPEWFCPPLHPFTSVIYPVHSEWNSTSVNKWVTEKNMTQCTYSNTSGKKILHVHYLDNSDGILFFLFFLVVKGVVVIIRPCCFICLKAWGWRHVCIFRLSKCHRPQTNWSCKTYYVFYVMESW